MILVVDTHPLVWLLEASRRLSSTAKRALQDDHAILVIPTIVLAEMRFLYAKHRIRADIDSVLELVERSERIRLSPLDSAVALALPTSLNIHDSIICGTALVYRSLLDEQVKVVTKDEEIRRSGLIETIW